MRVVIYGAGGIGSVVGGLLRRAGHEVALIGRPGHMTAINDHGLRLVTPTGTHILRLPAVTDPSLINFVPGDVVFLCMKGQGTEKALRDLRAVTKDVPVFCVQNGVRNEEIAARFFTNVYGVLVMVGAMFISDGEVSVKRNPPGLFVVGRHPRGTDELAEAVAGKLRSGGFSVMTSPDVMLYKWGKLMGNLANVIGAITNAGGDDVTLVARAVRQELRDLLEKGGIRWKSAGDLAQDWPEVATAIRARADTIIQNSTWQSLARLVGSTETEFLNGEVVRLAGKLGLQAPVNEALLRISLEMAAKREAPGKYTPGQLRALL